MRFPATPPAYDEIIKRLVASDKWEDVFSVTNQAPPAGYPHWDQLRRRRLPHPGLTHAEWWAAIKFARQSSLRSLPLTDKGSERFSFSPLEALHQQLHEIDRGAGQYLTTNEPIANPQTRDKYLISSLINEAITSSQLEGAVTTRAVAKEMIRTGRKPHDRSERMILNNYRTMERIRELKSEKLSKELVFDLHKSVTESTLENNSAAGRFRTAAEAVRIEDETGEIFFDPPPADQLEPRMQAMCDFANGTTPEYFVHPVIRAILLHFWLAYDHPFTDGNGRTARALFYWAMLHSGYWLIEFISISDVILKSPRCYYLAFLYTETDANDATYFVVHQLEVIQTAVEGLHAYIDRKSAEVGEAERLLRNWSGSLNHRQLALISHALRRPETTYTVEAHQRSHGTVYETARRDLLDLVKEGLLTKGKSGKTMVFRASHDLSERIKGPHIARSRL
jgi:Fic family protein